MDPNTLPGNSRTPSPTDYQAQSQGIPPRQPRQAVVSATVVPEAKKSFGQKLKAAFAPQQGQPDLGTSVLNNIVAPAVKGTIFAAVMGGLSAVLYGTLGNRGGYPGYGFGYGMYGFNNPYMWGMPRYGNPTGAVDYSALARGQAPTANQLPQPQGPTGATDVIFKTRAEAELVKDSLAEILVTYHQVSLLDFYETCGIKGNGYTDAYVGWNDLSQLRVRESYGGWIIDLPKPRPLAR